MTLKFGHAPFNFLYLITPPLNILHLQNWSCIGRLNNEGMHDSRDLNNTRLTSASVKGPLFGFLSADTGNTKRDILRKVWIFIKVCRYNLSFFRRGGCYRFLTKLAGSQIRNSMYLRISYYIYQETNIWVIRMIRPQLSLLTLFMDYHK